LVVSLLFGKTRCNFTYRSSASCCVVLLLKLLSVASASDRIKQKKRCLKYKTVSSASGHVLQRT